MLLLIKKIKNVHQHPFHLVNASLWPLSLSFSLFNFFLVILGYFNYYFMASIIWDLVSFTCILYTPIFYFIILIFFLWYKNMFNFVYYCFFIYNITTVFIKLKYHILAKLLQWGLYTENEVLLNRRYEHDLIRDWNRSHSGWIDPHNGLV